MPAEYFTNTAILIPAYNPGPALLDLVHRLMEIGSTCCIIINDGSGARHQEVFDRLSEIDRIHIVTHEHNKGKGAALKTGFRYIQQIEGNVGVITVDADGQHLPKDVERLAREAFQNKQNVVLGTRSFSTQVPLRSRLGNRLTSYLLDKLSGICLSDSQTGLRYLPRSLLHEVSGLESDGYDFELECLLIAQELGYQFQQLSIDTVYINSNESSHFRPIVDSYHVYKALFHFSGASLFCFVLDITLFTIFYHASANVMLATLVARTISGVANFSINKFYVFNRTESRRTLREGCEYLMLWLVIAVLSGSAVTLVEGKHMYVVVPFKIVADILLFFLSFTVQRQYIFADRAHPAE